MVSGQIGPSPPNLLVDGGRVRQPAGWPVPHSVHLADPQAAHTTNLPLRKRREMIQGDVQTLLACNLSTSVPLSSLPDVSGRYLLCRPPCGSGQDPC